MFKVSVIIPYFQRKSFILRKAVASILGQNLTADIEVEIIIVDDGSPVSANTEVEGIVFKAPFNLVVLTQANNGVASARNTGLKYVNDSTRYIAFLDSDDEWHPGHLAKGIRALENGFDFYFCDNKRQGRHESHFSSNKMSSINSFIPKNLKPDSAIALESSVISRLILKEFPTQASTVIYRRSIMPTLLFEECFLHAGEDCIFFLQLVNHTKKICFSPDIMVDCGNGVNIYFNNIDWNSPGHMKCIIDRLSSHIYIKTNVKLDRESYLRNSSIVSRLRRNVAFHTMRRFAQDKRVPPELREFARRDKWFAWWFSFFTVQVLLGRLTGLYKPS